MLHIWLPTQQGQLYVWLDKQNQWQSYENWQTVSEDITDREVCLYFPSRHVLQVDSDLSTSQLKQLGEAGRQYLFDDIALSNVEQLLVRQMTGAGRQYLYATSKTDIEQWKKSASLASFDIQYLLPDFLLLASSQKTGSIHLYHDEHTTLLRLSEAKGMAVSYLPLLLGQLDLIDEVQVMASVSDNTPQSNNSSSGVLTTLDELSIFHSQSSKRLMPVEHANRHPLNFVIKESKNRLSPYIKTAIMVAGLALFLQIVADGLSLRQYKQATASTTQMTNQQFEAWFPDTRLNSRTNMQSQLEPMLVSAESANSNTFAILQQASPLIKQSQVTAQSLLIEGETIQLQLLANNRGEFDQLVKKLSQQGINAQLGAIKSLDSNQSASKTAINTNDAKNSKKITGELTIVTGSVIASSAG